jgi:hypothetical protein
MVMLTISVFVLVVISTASSMVVSLVWFAKVASTVVLQEVLRTVSLSVFVFMATVAIMFVTLGGFSWLGLFDNFTFSTFAFWE